MKFQIAVDGPAGAGKSTVAKAVAERENMHYVDTGAMYRALAVAMADAGVEIESREAVVAALPDFEIAVEFDEAGQHEIVNGIDVTPFIRTPKASDAASKTSAYPEVRAKLMDLQKGLGRKYEVIMDGRDIGTVILPNAPLKIFITASAEVRGHRRYLELLEKGQTDITEEQVIADVKERDARDSGREAAPLKQADDARLLDTSDMGLEEVIDTVSAWAKEARAAYEG